MIDSSLLRINRRFLVMVSLLVGGCSSSSTSGGGDASAEAACTGAACGDDASSDASVGGDAAAGCTASGGTVGTSSCCMSSGDFPNSCLVGACGCAPANSHTVQVCTCPTGQCFNGMSCQAGP